MARKLEGRGGEAVDDSDIGADTNGGDTTSVSGSEGSSWGESGGSGRLYLSLRF